ncbi:hypothetical protein F4781DRAFT_430084 [Annulohypoxylon bovei var. microspora]|nr:hypothetical protein F4781DRAFT_430084 [Annulohypoxylon bovei var. microspora]
MSSASPKETSQTGDEKAAKDRLDGVPLHSSLADTNSLQYRLIERSMGARGPEDVKARCSEILNQIETYEKTYQLGSGTSESNEGDARKG